jgi:neutral ceramidase
MNKNSTTIRGVSAVSAFHVYYDFSNFTFQSPFNASRQLTTCPAALGFSFAAGTTDGPGAFDFTQNNTGSPSKSNPLWYLFRGILHNPSAAQKACQQPKNILLDVGSVNTPYEWAPNIVDIQALRVGQLLIIVSAGEASSMAGRRWKEAVAQSSMKTLGIADPIVVLGGPANSYVHYITTEEEYNVQRYEGASTLHGPHTLAAHINLTLSHLPYLRNTSASGSLPPLPPGPNPPINTNKSLSFITPVVYDTPPMRKSFGDIISSPPEDTTFRPGDTVISKFIGANPRNNLRLESTFAAVEHEVPDSDTWEIVRDDTDWSLVYHWGRKSAILGTSEVTLEWLIEDGYYNIANLRSLENGTYRMRYYGDARRVNGEIVPFEGVGGSFRVAI